MSLKNKRVYWLDGFEGKAKGGAYYRSKTAIDVDDFEEKFNTKIVGMAIDVDYENRKPSWNIEFITEVTK